MEVERTGLVDSVRLVLPLVAVATPDDRFVLEIAVYLVRGCEQEGGAGCVLPGRLEHIEGAQRVRFEVGPRIGH
jgi:hypothetical protein